MFCYIDLICLTLFISFVPVAFHIFFNQSPIFFGFTISGLLVTLDVNTLGTTLTISDSETLKVDKDITKAIASVFGRVRQLAGNTDIAVGISGSEKLTAAQKKDVENAFKKLGYKNIVLT